MWCSAMWQRPHTNSFECEVRKSRRISKLKNKHGGEINIPTVVTNQQADPPPLLGCPTFCSTMTVVMLPSFCQLAFWLYMVLFHVIISSSYACLSLEFLSHIMIGRAPIANRTHSTSWICMILDLNVSNIPSSRLSHS